MSITDPDKIIDMYDSRGQLQGVFVPAALWRKCEPMLREILRPREDLKNDFAGFEELMQCWNFQYPYSPAVKCPACGAQTLDWIKDPEKPFCLTNANIGGLLVFHCNNCGGTIRQKYFKRHMAEEFTPAGRD